MSFAFVEAAVAFLDSAEAWPGLGAQGRLSRALSQGIRHLVRGDYLVLYRVDPEAVTILTIPHGAMDYAEHLDLL
ncbi:type II toxin-antitoxin system RelE/ParE family toxin [Sphingomonas sp. BK235]|uniref:type II toxin-antitoxin system RelE/ParE family toxin n=1 Tax=Sphingomonas sp. BK235 TaxID=2512131 RepID=UPI0032619521